jgi:phytoene dehydrogenase-like protein
LCSLKTSFAALLIQNAVRFNEWYSAEKATSSSGSSASSLLQFPLGGASAVARALAASIERRGGVVSTRCRAESLVFSDDGKGRVVGVKLAGGSGEIVRASRAVVSNADAAGTLALARAAEGNGGPSSSAPAAASEALSAQEQKTPLLRSFVHLHAGFDALGLEGLDMHHLRVESWLGGDGDDDGNGASRKTIRTKIDAEQNVSLISIASVADPSLAPAGKHTLHAYYPATEPYGPWEELLREIERDGGMAKRSNRSKLDEFKEFRARNLIAAAEEAVPGLRERSEIFLIGGPPTHERYLNRSRGSYGPAWTAGKGFPGAKGPSGCPGNLFCVGDFSFPGVGVPAVAASGAAAASSLVGAAEHWRLLNELGI